MPRSQILLKSWNGNLFLTLASFSSPGFAFYHSFNGNKWPLCHCMENIPKIFSFRSFRCLQNVSSPVLWSTNLQLDPFLVLHSPVFFAQSYLFYSIAIIRSFFRTGLHAILPVLQSRLRTVVISQFQLAVVHVWGLLLTSEGLFSLFDLKCDIFSTFSLGFKFPAHFTSMFRVFGAVWWCDRLSWESSTTSKTDQKLQKKIETKYFLHLKMTKKRIHVART